MASCANHMSLEKELLDTGIVDSKQTVEGILMDCFDRFQRAKATVQANLPSSYISQSSSKEKLTTAWPNTTPQANQGH
jgi:hypothetical protein